MRQPTGDLCQAEQLCVEVHVFVGFRGRRNVSPFLRLKHEYVAFGDSVKEITRRSDQVPIVLYRSI